MTYLLLVLALALSACGGKNNPIAPPPPPPPQPAQIAGNFSGTFESSTYSPIAIFVSLNQTGTTISGTWSGTTGTNGIAGNITGTVDPSTFTGTISFSFNQTAGCSGSFTGSAAPNTLNWSSPGFTGNCGLSAPGNPLAPRFVLQRR